MAKDELNLTVRRVEVTEAVTLAGFGARLFEETFASGTPPQDLAEYLATTFGPEQQRSELEDPDALLLVATIGDEWVGYSKTVRGEPPPCDVGREPVQLQRFYVDSRWHGRGIADQLLERSLDHARHLGADVMWLTVWEQNTRAIRYYQRRAFVRAGAVAFPVGADIQVDLVMYRRP